MAAMSYLSTIERYHEYREAIRELLGSILTGISHGRLFTEPDGLHVAMCDIQRHYPFVSLLYTLDGQGIQSSDNVACPRRRRVPRVEARGTDRSQRPYFQLARTAQGVVVTEPYLSTASGMLCVSAAVRCLDAHGALLGYTVFDIDLGETVEFLMGDVVRRRFQPGFRAVYSLIVVGLFTVVGLLLWAAFLDVSQLFAGGETHTALQLRPFGVIIYLTLGLAVFDLGKTILEEEVLMHKDIFRHSSTRRTITRFVAAILIAVSIEALLMMFKAALGQGEDMLAGVWMMLTAIGLQVGLGIYVYLGARAEVALLRQRGARR
jgi:hypothetical protein